MSFTVRKAEIKGTIDCVCSLCGDIAQSETITISLPVGYYSVGYLTQTLNSQKLGTNFPEGWSKEYHYPADILKCPKCLEGETDANDL